jgi:hypothetical protein
LFRTLAADAELCALVKSLDVRFFPLDLQGDELINLEQNVLAALGRMTNLTKLVWTVSYVPTTFVLTLSATDLSR